MSPTLAPLLALLLGLVLGLLGGAWHLAVTAARAAHIGRGSGEHGLLLALLSTPFGLLGPLLAALLLLQVAPGATWALIPGLLLSRLLLTRPLARRLDPAPHPEAP